MIVFSLRLTAESTIELEDLLDRSWGTVRGALESRGLAIRAADPTEFRGHDACGRHCLYALAPGPATLTVSTDHASRCVEFVVEGATFGRPRRLGDQDKVLWMRLVTAGVQLAEMYLVCARVYDPDQESGNSEALRLVPHN